MEDESGSPEWDLTVFNDWIKNLCLEGKVGDIDAGIVRSVLESYGADFKDISESDR